MSFYNIIVWDTFCVGKTMTCDLCFIPAGYLGTLTIASSLLKGQKGRKSVLGENFNNNNYY